MPCGAGVLSQPREILLSSALSARCVDGARLCDKDLAPHRIEGLAPDQAPMRYLLMSPRAYVLRGHRTARLRLHSKLGEVLPAFLFAQNKTLGPTDKGGTRHSILYFHADISPDDDPNHPPPSSSPLS